MCVCVCEILGGAVPSLDVWAVEITLRLKVLPRLSILKPPYDVTADGARVGPLEAIPHARPLRWTQPDRTKLDTEFACVPFFFFCIVIDIGSLFYNAVLNLLAWVEWNEKWE